MYIIIGPNGNEGCACELLDNVQQLQCTTTSMYYNVVHCRQQQQYLSSLQLLFFLREICPRFQLQSNHKETNSKHNKLLADLLRQLLVIDSFWSCNFKLLQSGLFPFVFLANASKQQPGWMIAVYMVVLRRGNAVSSSIKEAWPQKEESWNWSKCYTMAYRDWSSMSQKRHSWKDEISEINQVDFIHEESPEKTGVCWCWLSYVK